MKFIIVDISVWSKALRKKSLSDDEKKMINYLEKIIRDGRVIMIGAFGRKFCVAFQMRIVLKNYGVL